MNHITTTGSTTTTLCAFVILATVLAALAITVVHLLPTGVNPLTEAVSDYGVGKYKNFYRLAAFWLGAAGLILSIAIGRAVFPKPTVVILMLLIFAAVRWSITLFPTDLPGEEETSVGRAHVVLAAAAFSSISVAALIFPAYVNDDTFWRPYDTLLTVLGFAVLVTTVVTAIAKKRNKLFGLAERLLYVAMIAWLIAVASILGFA